MKNRNLLPAAAVLLVAILFVALNVLSNTVLNTARFDLTEDRLFTLSDGTRRIVSNLEEPVRLRFYFSESLANQLPSIRRYGQRVRDMLEEYVNLADGRIRLEVVDPEPFSVEEDEAVRVGLQAFPLGPGENVYFGLVGVNTTDDQEEIPFFNQEKEQFLEYDLTRMIYNLSDPQRPVVTLITDHEMNAQVNSLMRLGGGGPEPWALVDVIRETHDLKVVGGLERRIPEDTDILLVIHPAKLEADIRYQIDQYVLGGGHTIVFVDPFSEIGAASSQRGMMGMGQTRIPDSSKFAEQLAAWGVAVDPDKVVADWQLGQEVNMARPGGTARILRYLPWLEITPEHMNREDVVMADLGPMAIPTAGHIAALPDAGTRLTPLITTSVRSQLIDADDVRFRPDPQLLIEKFTASEDSYVLAARVTGTARTAYPDGKPGKTDGDSAEGAGKDGDGEESNEAGAPAHREAGEINVLLVADTDMLHERFWLRVQDFFGQKVLIPFAANGDFVVNALDNMAGSSDLIGLRSRGKSNRPFEVVDGLRRAAEQQFLQQERDLNARLEERQKEITELQSKARAGGGALLSEQQQAKIAEAQSEVLETRRQLREVQHNLNKDIEALETRLKVANIAIVPVAVALVALVLAAFRYRRRARRAAVRD